MTDHQKENLKIAFLEAVECLSSWTDNGECREYQDIDKAKAEEMFGEMIKDYESYMGESQTTK